MAPPPRTVMPATEDLGRLAAELRSEVSTGLTFMEVCGTHTMAIARHAPRAGHAGGRVAAADLLTSMSELIQR